MTVVAGALLLTAPGCRGVFEDDEYAYVSTSSTNDNDEGEDEDIVDVKEDSGDYELSDNDSDVAYIHCNNTSFTVEGNTSLVDIKTSGVKIELKETGTYYIDGTLDDGQIQVDADSVDVVKVVFNGVTLNCSSEAAFRVKDCEKTIVTIADGTTNTITDGSANADSAALYSKRYLAFNGGEKGTGVLNVTANGAGADGIACTKQLVFNSGTYNVTAADDGIRGKLCLLIHDGNFTVKASGDGLKSTSTTTGYGYISIDKGTFDIQSADEGMQAESNITIKDGTYTITKSDKCIAALGDIVIDGGTFTLTPTVANGAGHGITIKKNDDEVREGNVTINGGSINVTKSYEGIQGVIITVNGGEIWVNSTDDAFNASNGSSQIGGMGGGGWGGRPGQTTTTTTTSTSTTTPHLIFNGGFVYVKAQGDGIDSNGELSIKGGIVLVSQNGQANEPIDAGDGYTPTVSGGVLVAVGTQGMATAPSATQTAFFITTSGSANSVLAVNDSDGNNILAWKVPQAYQVVTVSAPELSSGTYTLITGATVKGSEYVSGSGFYYPATSASGSGTNITLTSGKCTSTSGSSSFMGPGGGGFPGNW